MIDEKLKQIVKEELEDENRANNTNEFIFRVYNRLGYNFNNINHRREMPSCETITRMARYLKKEFPWLKGSQREQEIREKLENQYREDYQIENI